MSNVSINQDFKVISNSVDAISTQNGSIAMDTAPSGHITFSQNTTPIVNITEDGSMVITAKDAQNIYLTTSNGGKTIISDLDYTDKDGILMEQITISHDTPSTEITVVAPDSGSYQVLIDGVVDDAAGTSSDCSACIFMAKKKTGNSVVNTLCNIQGDQGESLKVTWTGTTISISLDGGTLANYTVINSTFKVKLFGC